MKDTNQTYKVAKVTTARPSMNIPSITITGEMITVKDTLNGSFLGGYRVFSDGKFMATLDTNTKIDLGELPFDIVTNHDITVRAYSEFFNDSDDSNSVVFKMKGYNKLENETGTTAVITANYKIEVNPNRKSAEVCILI